MKKVFILSLVLASITSASSAFASGTVRCETQYGGGQTCQTVGNIIIDKKVCDISTANCDPDENYFDNMTLSNHLFQVGEQVIFRLTVTNTSNETINKVTVTDYLPDYLILAKGQTTYEITNLKPGASDTKRIDTLVSSELPQGTLCEFNRATADSGDGLPDQDQTQICLGKGTPVTTVPEAGPEGVVLLFTSSLLLAGSGIFLNKFAR